MPVTLLEAKKNTQDALQMGIIDEYRKNSILLDSLTFDNSVSPTGGGTTMTYAYTRLITQPTAQFRAVNTEYTPQEVTRQRYTAELKVFGGSYQIDRVIADMGGIVDEVILQSRQKVKAAIALFNDTVINGDVGSDPLSFDGLDVAIAGTTTDFTPSVAIDLSTAANIKANWEEWIFHFDEFLSLMHFRPTYLLMNGTYKARIQSIARLAGTYTETKDDFGRKIQQIDGIPLIDLGAKMGSNDDVVETDAGGLSDLYAVYLGLDGFHAVSTANGSPIKTWLPDYSTSGAVKTGEVEMLACTVLKHTKSAGVMRGVKIK